MIRHQPVNALSKLQPAFFGGGRAIVSAGFGGHRDGAKGIHVTRNASSQDKLRLLGNLVSDDLDGNVFGSLYVQFRTDGDAVLEEIDKSHNDPQSLGRKLPLTYKERQEK